MEQAFSMELIAESGDTALYAIRSGEYEALGVSTFVRDCNGTMLQITCPHGLLVCRAFSTGFFDKIHVAMAVFAAPTFEAMLNANPVELSSRAIEKGATTEMTGADIVRLFSA